MRCAILTLKPTQPRHLSLLRPSMSLQAGRGAGRPGRIMDPSSQAAATLLAHSTAFSPKREGAVPHWHALGECVHPQGELAGSVAPLRPAGGADWGGGPGAGCGIDMWS